jgi:coenzyme F420-reducing hydrogenase gamma subunit
MSSDNGRKPRIAVFKFASCDGCQLSLLDAEEELLAVVGAVEIAYFPEASRRMSKGPYDIGIVEGSITTHHDAEHIQHIRRQCHTLVTIGACATAGGIQALRNWRDVNEFVRYVYASPDYISTLKMSTPVAEHVPVDFELRGCPINKYHLVELITATLAGRRPNIPTYSVCLECKRRGNVCVTVAQGVPCLGPVTQAGCGALCPTYNRGCYGCFGPMESCNAQALSRQLRILGQDDAAITRIFRGFNAWSWQFRQASEGRDQA